MTIDFVLLTNNTRQHLNDKNNRQTVHRLVLHYTIAASTNPVPELPLKTPQVTTCLSDPSRCFSSAGDTWDQARSLNMKHARVLASLVHVRGRMF